MRDIISTQVQTINRSYSTHLPVWWIFSRLLALSEGSIRNVYWDANALLCPFANRKSLPNNWYSALCCLYYASSFASNVSMLAAVTCWRRVLPIDTASDVLLPGFILLGAIPLEASLNWKDMSMRAWASMEEKQTINRNTTWHDFEEVGSKHKHMIHMNMHMHMHAPFL